MRTKANNFSCIIRPIVFLVEVVKKLWGYIKKKGKQDRLTINVIVIVENEKKECAVTVDVEIEEKSKDELIDSIASNTKLTKADAGRALDAFIESTIKLKRFKATEPEI